MVGARRRRGDAAGGTDLQMREVTLTGIFRYVDTWPVAIFAGRERPGRPRRPGHRVLRPRRLSVEAALTSDDDPMSMKSVVVVDGGRRS